MRIYFILFCKYYQPSSPSPFSQSIGRREKLQRKADFSLPQCSGGGKIEGCGSEKYYKVANVLGNILVRPP